MLEIALEKVCFIIAKARELDAKVEAGDPGWGSGAGRRRGRRRRDRGPRRRRDPDRARGCHRIVNEEESLHLVALVWLGRGDFTAEEWSDAVIQARTDRSAPTVDYLMGTPLLPDYLEEGLNLLGLSCEGVT